MGGNENSGRKKKLKNPTQIHFYMEKEDVESLNEMAEKFSNNNRSDLITETLKRLINTYEQSK